MLPVNENINVGATVSYMKDIDVRGAKKNAVFGEIGTDIKFNDDWYWMAAVSKSNIKAYNDAGQKIKNDGVFTEVRYKSADWNVRNSYDVFLNYRRVGSLSGVSSVEDYSKKRPRRANRCDLYSLEKLETQRLLFGRQTGYAYRRHG